MKSFLLKVKHFFKRNIYPITVGFCTVLILTIVTISAYRSILGTDTNTNVTEIETNSPVQEPIVDTGTKEDEKEKEDVVKPTTSVEPIVFDLPFSGASITKAYAETYHLYDKTSNYWQTHQGLDFACSEGTVAKAVFAGKIEKIVNSMMDGTVIYLKINDDLTVVYKGLASNVSVKEGDRVEKGAVLGTIVSFLTEKRDGIHLHLELLKNNVLIDPTEYFPFNK